MSAPRGNLHKESVYLDAGIALSRGLRIGEVVRQRITTEALARKVSAVRADRSADIIKRTDEEREQRDG